ncbi:hypothetical protein IF188_12900 [Microbacterium sp. NEAU-LLC]|uniref:Uncharacterized protein n=1 Tax=Microbacterium helvum TaxID=2773713 RepID=A0ABR8NPL5_9MICO|nr:hypothetical protein [Microbacterium helvum]MBD3942597.1 hypothetical protein [Microbacterium helvum]
MTFMTGPAYAEGLAGGCPPGIRILTSQRNIRNAMYETGMPRLLVVVTPNLEDPMSAASTGILRTELDTAVAASRADREAAERELSRSRAARSRAADALELSARRAGCDEHERAQLRLAYVAADRVVAESQAALNRARELENAVTVVAGAYGAAPSLRPVAAAVLESVTPAPAARASRARAARASARRAEPAARLRGTRPRTA